MSIFVAIPHDGQTGLGPNFARHDSSGAEQLTPIANNTFGEDGWTLTEIVRPDLGEDTTLEAWADAVVKIVDLHRLRTPKIAMIKVLRHWHDCNLQVASAAIDAAQAR